MSEQVRAVFKSESYHYLKKTIREQQDFIHRLSIHCLAKKALMDNMTRISSTIEKAEKDGKIFPMG
jgi:plasmid replication initiation protein